MRVVDKRAPESKDEDMKRALERGFVAGDEFTELGRYRMAITRAIDAFHTGKGYRRNMEDLTRFLLSEDASE